MNCEFVPADILIMIPNQHIFIIYRTFREEVFMELSFTTWPLMTDS